MKISEAIKTLQEIQARFGDIAITGGYLQDDTELTQISVTDTDGYEVWPNGEYGDAGKIDGVFLS